MQAATSTAIKTDERGRDEVHVPMDLDQIQGNIAGFNKDFQTFLFLRFPDGEQAETTRQWLGDVAAQVATAEEVLAFNDLFRAIGKRRKARKLRREGVVEATWLNIAFTHAGLRKLGSLPEDLAFPREFERGMRAQAEEIGDEGLNAPEHWDFPAEQYGKPDDRRQLIDALLILAADDQADLDAEAGRQIAALTAAGIALVFKQDGATRTDLPGHEHFGFRDGVSQPAFRNRRLSPPDDLQEGQERVPPGEIVLGYPTEGGDAPVHGWLRNGSYLVFRRLRQNVRAFQDFLREQAVALRINEDLLGAKLVGRYRSGAPLAALTAFVHGANEPPDDEIPPSGILGQPDDPGLRCPVLLDRENINNFEYAKLDNEGLLVPRAAHIRKVYPRDQNPPGEEVGDAKRILRRGIPFGQPYCEGADEPPRGPAFPHDRGLIFVCYQNSIADKFEFLQREWVNHEDVPAPVRTDGPHPGIDPIIAQKEVTRDFDIPGTPRKRLGPLPQWVTTTGGDYFFSPSIDTLARLSGGCPSQRPSSEEWRAQQ